MEITFDPPSLLLYKFLNKNDATRPSFPSNSKNRCKVPEIGLFFERMNSKLSSVITQWLVFAFLVDIRYRFHQDTLLSWAGQDLLIRSFSCSRYFYFRGGEETGPPGRLMFAINS